MGMTDDVKETQNVVSEESAPATKIRVGVARIRVIGFTLCALGAFIAGVFGLAPGTKPHSTLTFDPVNLSSAAPWHLGALTVSTWIANLLLGLIVLALGVEVVVRLPERGVLVRFGIGAAILLISLLLWSARTPGPSPVPFFNLTAVLLGGATIASVLVFGSLSGVLCERSGVVNIAIEGQFIGGALVGAIVTSVTHDFFLAAAAGILLGGLIGLLLAFLSIRYQSDQIIVGVVIVTMLGGLSSYLTAQVLTPYQNLNIGQQPPNWPIWGLSKIPIIGPVLFNQNGFFYVMILLVVAVSVGLFRTRWGLRVRAVGEHPKAAESVGISVARVRYGNVVMGGAVAGLGGVAFISIHGAFQPGITSGFGYIALAAMIFGRWRPSGAVVASIIFGLSVYLGQNLQTYNVPIDGHILDMFPYLVTIAVVAGLIGRVRPPAADGQPYKRD
jgi:simple sugar transport system permease protein